MHVTKKLPLAETPFAVNSGIILFYQVWNVYKWKKKTFFQCVIKIQWSIQICRLNYCKIQWGEENVFLILKLPREKSSGKSSIQYRMSTINIMTLFLWTQELLHYLKCKPITVSPLFICSAMSLCWALIYKIMSSFIYFLNLYCQSFFMTEVIRNIVCLHDYDTISCKLCLSEFLLQLFSQPLMTFNKH